MVVALAVTGFSAVLTGLLALQVAAGLKAAEFAEQQRARVVESLRG